MNENSLERYRQRYETWRHLDRLRYIILEVSAGVLVSIVAIIELFKAGLPIWSWLAISTFLFFQSKILEKINDGIVANGEALRKFGAEIGDDLLPNTSERKGSIFYIFEWILLFFACFFFIVWILKFIGALGN